MIHRVVADCFPFRIPDPGVGGSAEYLEVFRQRLEIRLPRRVFRIRLDDQAHRLVGADRIAFERRARCVRCRGRDRPPRRQQDGEGAGRPAPPTGAPASSRPVEPPGGHDRG